MEASDFRWPDDPPEDWWQVTGTGLGLKPEKIRFAAALFQLGGADSKKNSVAARLAGMTGGRGKFFRDARSFGVRRLLDQAEKIKVGKQPRLTEEEIDRRIEDLIRSPDAGTVAKGTELRMKRQEQARQRSEVPENDGLSPWRMERDFLTFQNGASAYVLLIGGIGNLYLLHDTHAVLMAEDGGPELWRRFYDRLNNDARAMLDRHLADPGFQLDVRKKIWAEIGRPPPGPLSTDAVDMLRRDPAATAAASSKANGHDASAAAA